MNGLCFFMSCDRKYSQFIFPFVYFSHIFNQGSNYEFLLNEGINDRDRINLDKLCMLEKINIKLTYVPNNIKADRIRFIYEPSINYQFAYIGDIDILILEEIAKFHLNNMQAHQTIFDNYIRPNNRTHLSGLQFCTKEYFDKTKDIRLKYFNNASYVNQMNDEELLLQICNEAKLKIHQINDNEFWPLRPIHGIHMSQNRQPFKENSPHKFLFDKKYGYYLLQLIDNFRFKRMIYPLFNEEYKDKFEKIVHIIERTI